MGKNRKVEAEITPGDRNFNFKLIREDELTPEEVIAMIESDRKNLEEINKEIEEMPKQKEARLKYLEQTKNDIEKLHNKMISFEQTARLWKEENKLENERRGKGSGSDKKEEGKADADNTQQGQS
jgi:delta-aminolevulinic acid dehydratase/porphobilinogen synthase